MMRLTAACVVISAFSLHAPAAPEGTAAAGAEPSLPEPAPAAAPAYVETRPLFSPSAVPQGLPFPRAAAPPLRAPTAPPPHATLTPANPKDYHFRVSKITYEYGPVSAKARKALPPIEKVVHGEVELGRFNHQFSVPDKDAPTTKVPVTGGKADWYGGDALEKLYGKVVENLNHDYGVYGVYVIADPKEIDPFDQSDKRGGKTTLKVKVFVSEIQSIRSLSRTLPPGPNDPAVLDSRQHARIREHSPVQPSSADGTGIFLKGDVQDFLDRINRFQGRRADASLGIAGGRDAASAESGDFSSGKISLDYMVREQKKQISVYAQTGNTGTEQTGEWRSRLGLEYRQPLRQDDVLRLEYSTSDFSGYQSALFSYEFTPVFPDYLKLKAYVNWGRYSAADVGQSLVSFSGESFTYGTVATWTPLYVLGCPVDFYAGAEWLHASVKNNIAGAGSTDFLLPYVGIATEKSTNTFTLGANFEMQMNLRRPAGTDTGANLDILGRSNTDNSFTIGKWNLNLSAFLEPILFGNAWSEQTDWWKSTRAHEIAINFRGQFAADAARLPPQLQYVAGGFYTVRGYPESFAAGDSAMVATLEYRFHLPRVLKPRDQLKGRKKKESEGSGVVPPEREQPVRARGFDALRPASIAGGQDWDLILRGFIDYGQTSNHGGMGLEPDRTLVGAGGGIELQLFKPVFASVRLDYGVALRDVRDLPGPGVRAGYSRLNLTASLAW